MALIAGWIGTARPTAMVVDVSAEVTLLARTLGVPVATVAMAGDRRDRPHQMAYDAATTLVACWPADVRPVLGWQDTWDAKTTWTGAFSRFDALTPRTATRRAPGGVAVGTRRGAARAGARRAGASGHPGVDVGRRARPAPGPGVADPVRQRRRRDARRAERPGGGGRRPPTGRGAPPAPPARRAAAPRNRSGTGRPGPVAPGLARRRGVARAARGRPARRSPSGGAGGRTDTAPRGWPRPWTGWPPGQPA